jgi:hypothetical protein
MIRERPALRSDIDRARRRCAVREDPFRHHGGVTVATPRIVAVASRIVPRGPVFWIVLIALFLVSRLIWLDADIPQWELTVYSPIDEFGYTVPAFNLVTYGTWVHQAAPWAPLEGPPINVLQNIVVALTLSLGGDTYWGLRLSSVVFGLVVLGAMVLFIRRQSDDARRVHGAPAMLADVVVVAAAVLMLADFSSLLSGRIVEPTISRLAAVAVVLALVGRGTFFGAGHGLARSAVFGALIGGAVLFVYIYNAFLGPAALAVVVWWGWRAGGVHGAVRHALAFVAGSLVVAALYFGLILLIYHQSPLDWVRTWILDFATNTRGNGFSLGKIAAIAEANIFRLDPVFLALTLVSLPVAVWATWRRPTASGIIVLAGAA